MAQPCKQIGSNDVAICQIARVRARAQARARACVYACTCRLRMRHARVKIGARCARSRQVHTSSPHLHAYTSTVGCLHAKTDRHDRIIERVERLGGRGRGRGEEEEGNTDRRDKSFGTAVDFISQMNDNSVYDKSKIFYLREFEFCHCLFDSSKFLLVLE